MQIYGQLEELAASVAEYLATGFELGAPGVVVATADHWEQSGEALASRGWDAAALEAQGLLTVVDADAMLSEFMVGDAPSPEGFERVVGGLVDGVAARFPEQSIRAFGEMVDVLCQRGQVEAAASLEGLWNELARTRNFSLLCSYRLDIFDRASQLMPMPAVCVAHSHVQPSADPARFAEAVDLAMEEILGPHETGRVYMVLGEQAREQRVPLAQLALMWVSENMPVRANRVLSRARVHYYSEPISVADS